MRDERGSRPVSLRGESVITPLGDGIERNLEALRKGRTGIEELEAPTPSLEGYYGGKVDDTFLEDPNLPEAHPRFERLSILASRRTIEASGLDPTDPSLLFILATTKGNIDRLGEQNGNSGREYLHRAAQFLSSYWGNPNEAWVVSNACISGVLAIDTAADLIRNDRYKKVLVVGADILSSFTVSGFQAFQAMASTPCRPFDAQRDGLNLGEGAGAVLLEEADPKRDEERIQLLSGASSNDANHISGPSRSGEGLFRAIRRTLSLAEVGPEEIDHLNAHGTATSYNDEMEALAFSRSGLSECATNSYKGALGHSLGAAGVIESALTLACMRRNELLPSVGYEEHGVSSSLDVLRKNEKKELNTCLKSSSGFGGCNAAILLRKG